jgi:lipopolysaccharide export system ATP-binding protein
MICGLVKPDRGEVYLQSENVTRWPLHRRSREGAMGYLPQQTSLFTKLSVQANLTGMMQLLNFSRKQQKHRCEELLEQFDIGHVRKSLAGTLSGGERRRLEIARCLVADPRIIMLDEPFAAIDPVTVQNIQVVIKELATKGIAILITDHAAREILQITDRTYVVSEGRILCDGTADEIVQNERVRREYLGDIEIPGSTSDASERTNERVQTVPFTPGVASGSHSGSQSTSPNESASGLTSAGTSEAPKRPKIVFSKPRRSKPVSAPFKSTDLD